MKNKLDYSRIIAGTMTWGSWGKQLSTEESIRLMHHCVEHGITTFDHADIYGGYTNEAAFGKALAQAAVERDKIHLISKCGIQYVCEARNNKIKHYNYNKEYIISSAEASLKNLQTEYLDLFLLHRPSPLMHPEEVATAVSQLLAEGKIKQFGVSNFSPSQIALIETAVPVRANQVEFSLTAPGVMHDGTLDDCIIHDRMAMSWSPLGAYFRKEGEQIARIKPEIEQLCEKYKATESQLLLAWILRHPAKVHPVVGTTNLDRLRESMEALKIALDLEDWFGLLVASQGHKVP